MRCSSDSADQLVCRRAISTAFASRASEHFKSLGRSGDVTAAQHCRAEVYVDGFGWIPVDPADVRKVVLEEEPGGTLDDRRMCAARARAALRIVGDELDRVQRRARRRASRIEGKAAAVSHVSAGRGRRRATRQP